MKKLLILGIIAVLLASIGTVIAKSVIAPPKFVPYQPPESELKKIVFIRYAPGKEPSSVCDDDGVCEPRENWKNCPNDCPKGNGETTTTTVPSTTTCYGFLSGAMPKWNWVEDYYYSQGLGSTSNRATGKWNAATSATIFGEGYSGGYPWGEYDYINSISYGDYSNPNVIAVTAIWYRGKNIYEYDIMFDTDYFPDDVDLDTISLHEFGHGAGLDDLYDSVCAEEVMYGYYVGAKHNLQQGDITGIQLLYGA